MAPTGHDRHRLDDVRIERALRQEVEPAQLACALCSNTSMNVAPMIFRFCSGSVTPGEPLEEQIAGVDEVERQVQLLA